MQILLVSSLIEDYLCSMKVLEGIKKCRLSCYNLSILGVQVDIYVLLVSIQSLVIMLLEHDVSAAKGSMCVNAFVLFLLLTVLMANFYVLVPYLFEVKDKIKCWVLWVISLLFIVLWNHHIFSIYNADLPGASIRIGFYQSDVMWMTLNYVMVVMVISARYYTRHNTLGGQLREEEQKMTEVELAWLKNQPNPYFLSNTFDNIASLIQISPNNARKVTGQLPELLHYAFYETQPKEASLNDEIAFTKNHTSLTTLWSGNDVEIKSQFIIHDAQLFVVPLISLTPVENAFKHGISANKPSFIYVSITEDNDKIAFLYENSNYPKNGTDRSGKGIGLENMHRRLELIYPDRYYIEQHIASEIYRLKTIIRLQ